MRRVLPLGGAAVWAALLLAGCGEERPARRQVLLRVVNWATDLELASEQRIAEGFSERHPDVRVLVESIVTNYGEKLATSIASGTPPDVFLLDAPDIPAFVERGLVLDLAPYAARVGYAPEEVFPQVLGVFEKGRRVYAFPKGFTPLVIYYNPKLFRRLGVKPPPEQGWTWREFLETARRLTRDTNGDGRTDIYAVNFPRQLYEWIPFVWSGGGDILDPQGRHTAGYLDSPETVAAFRFLTSWISHEHIAPPVQFLRSGDPLRVGRFYMGQQAMLISGHWHLPRLLSYAEKGRLEIGVAPIPHREGARAETVLYASGWAVPSNVRHRRLAVELAAFLAGAEAERARAAGGLEIPALRRVALDLAAADPLGVEKAFLAQVEKARPPWGARVMDFHEIEEMSLDIMDRCLLRGQPIQRVASEVAREIDRVISR